MGSKWKEGGGVVASSDHELREELMIRSSGQNLECGDVEGSMFGTALRHLDTDFPFERRLRWPSLAMVEKRRLSQPARFSKGHSEAEGDIEFCNWLSRSSAVAVIASNQLNVVVRQALSSDMVLSRARIILMPPNRVSNVSTLILQILYI